jgi:tetratricopeptide (TPR) repeat protein/tRNA A-37 threonylcarbamoyl transferase component Bud32
VDVLVRWEELQECGQSVAPEELCRDCPDVLLEVRRRLEDLRGEPLAELMAASAPPVAQRGGADVAWTMSAGRYQPRRFHARGGLGEVYLADDQELQREVALKRMQESLTHDEASRRRFLREAHITSRLGHPGIVPVHGLVQDDQGRPCYAMRFIDGTSLKDAIAAFHQADRPGRDPGERSLALRELLGRFVAVSNTVAYAHSRGIVHCDLKPANIMLGKYGETLVIDWGLARPFGRTEAERADREDTLLRPAAPDDGGTRLGEAKGTPAFMSPEQAAGRWDVVGPAGDVYSLGATLYQLLTGEVPFKGTNHAEVLQKVQRGAMVRPRQVKPATPPALEAVCLKAMGRAPGERYAGALELAADVTSWLADEPVRAYREPLRARLGRWRRRHKTAVASAAVALVLVTVGGGLGAFLYWQAAEQRRYDHLAFLRATAEGNDEVALNELRAGNFASAEKILDQALVPLADEPDLSELRTQLEARLDRARRLARFQWLSDEADRLEQMQGNRPDFFGESGAAIPCHEGLAQLGVFQEVEWWRHLPDADLLDRQKEELRQDAYHQLILLAAIRAKQGARHFLNPQKFRPFFESAMKALKCANDYNHNTFVGTRAEAFALFGIGQGDKAKPLMVAEPQTPTDHFFLGLYYLGVSLADDPAWGVPRRGQFLLRVAASFLKLNLDKPKEQAVLHLKLAADQRPRHYWSHCWLAYSLRKAGQVEAAEQTYAICVALRPGYATAYSLRAELLMDQWAAATYEPLKNRLLKRALDDYNEIIRIEPGSSAAHNERGFIYQEMGERDRAIDDFTEAIRLDPKNAAAFVNLGCTYRDSREYDRAFSNYEKALRLAPKAPRIYHNRGLAYFQQRRYDQAIADFDRAIDLAPNYVGAYSARADAKEAKGDLAGASADREKASRLKGKPGPK